MNAYKVLLFVLLRDLFSESWLALLGEDLPIFMIPPVNVFSVYSSCRLSTVTLLFNTSFELNFFINPLFYFLSNLHAKRHKQFDVKFTLVYYLNYYFHIILRMPVTVVLGMFTWDDYLAETGETPAPQSCFKQVRQLY